MTSALLEIEQRLYEGETLDRNLALALIAVARALDDASRSGMEQLYDRVDMPSTAWHRIVRSMNALFPALHV